MSEAEAKSFVVCFGNGRRGEAAGEICHARG